jgi:hypothetical protein
MLRILSTIAPRVAVRAAAPTLAVRAAPCVCARAVRRLHSSAAASAAAPRREAEQQEEAEEEEEETRGKKKEHTAAEEQQGEKGRVSGRGREPPRRTPPHAPFNSAPLLSVPVRLVFFSQRSFPSPRLALSL